MKSEERHTPETNQLGEAVQVAGKRLEDNTTKIVGVVCAVLLIAAAVTWWMRQSNSSAVAAWTLLENAETVAQYSDIREKYSGTIPGRWAQLLESELYLKTGLEQMFTDRELGSGDLKKAINGFQELNSTKADQAIHERALWGLALALEATSDGDTTKASEAYQRLLNDVPDTTYRPIAEQRIAALKTGGVKDFYAWFSKQNPKPADVRPKDSGFKDDFDSMLPPAKSEFNLKPGSEKATEGQDDKKADEPKPAAEGEKSEGKPDAPAVKEEQPTGEEKLKAEEKPAAEKETEPKADKPADKKE